MARRKSKKKRIHSNYNKQQNHHNFNKDTKASYYEELKQLLCKDRLTYKEEFRVNTLLRELNNFGFHEK
jgi:hypothetical protein